MMSSTEYAKLLLSYYNMTTDALKEAVTMQEQYPSVSDAYVLEVVAYLLANG